MELKRTRKEIAPEINFYDGISLSDYNNISNRWDEILLIIHREISGYINDDKLCFEDEENLFPLRSKLTGNYYIDKVSYTKRINPVGYQITVSIRLTETVSSGEDDYLGLEVTLYTISQTDNFEVWGIDSSSI